MKFALRVLLMGMTLGVYSTFAQDICKRCDCTTYPVKKTCEKCCGVATGTIRDLQATQLSMTASKGKTTEEFKITKDTKIEGQLKEGASVRIVYNKDTNVIGFVEVTSSH